MIEATAFQLRLGSDLYLERESTALTDELSNLHQSQEENPQSHDLLWEGIPRHSVICNNANILCVAGGKVMIIFPGPGPG